MKKIILWIFAIFLYAVLASFYVIKKGEYGFSDYASIRICGVSILFFGLLSSYFLVQLYVKIFGINRKGGVNWTLGLFSLVFILFVFLNFISLEIYTVLYFVEGSEAASKLEVANIFSFLGMNVNKFFYFGALLIIIFFFLELHKEKKRKRKGA